MQLYDSLTISVEADDTDGSITEVHFYVDENIIDIDTSYPFVYHWDTFNETMGAHVLQIIAYDNLGDSATTDILIVLSEFFIDQRDNQMYKMVKVGNQIWLAENLKYRTEEGSWSFYDDSTNEKKYGRLYNWETALTACPDGWHLPSDSEWKEMENYLIENGYNYDGSTSENKIGKSLAANSEWEITWFRPGIIGTDLASNNSTGFSALPGSRYLALGDNAIMWDLYLGLNAYFWTSTTTETNTDFAWYRSLHNDEIDLKRDSYSKNNGHSVRCVKDL